MVPAPRTFRLSQAPEGAIARDICASELIYDELEPPDEGACLRNNCDELESPNEWAFSRNMVARKRKGRGRV